MNRTSPVVAIRAAAGRRIGLGHVARCTALAQAFAGLGACVHMVGPDPDQMARSFLAPRGLRHHALAEGLSQTDDAGATVSVSSTLPDVVVVDDYAIGDEWWSCVRDAGIALLVVDDLIRGDLRAFSGIHVLNQNAGIECADYPAALSALCGPTYALLRSEFTGRLADRRVRGEGSIRNVIVSFGGSDPLRLSAVVAGALEAACDPEQITVIAGPTCAAREELEALAQDSTRVRVHVAPPDTAALFAEADAAVVAGGSTVYELAFLGVPMALVQVADNQAGICRAMHRTGAASFLGEGLGLARRELEHKLSQWLSDSTALSEQSRRGLGLVDGRGAERVATAMLAAAKPGPDGPSPA